LDSAGERSCQNTLLAQAKLNWIRRVNKDAWTPISNTGVRLPSPPQTKFAVRSSTPTAR